MLIFILSIYTFSSSENEGTVQTGLICWLIYAFIVHIKCLSRFSHVALFFEADHKEDCRILQENVLFITMYDGFSGHFFQFFKLFFLLFAVAIFDKGHGVDVIHGLC